MGSFRRVLLLLASSIFIVQLANGECEENGSSLWPKAGEKSTGTDPLMRAENPHEGNREEAKPKKCKEMAQELKALFLAAREASIQGDSCSSAKNAREFLKKLEKLRAECSPVFSEKVGFTQKVVKNVTRLEILGVKQCPNLTQESPTTREEE